MAKQRHPKGPRDLDAETFRQLEAQRKPKVLTAKTQAQKAYLNSIHSNTITLGIGPAGVGKSFLSGASAAIALQQNEVEKIIITRPAVESGESFGFLPGTLQDKFQPYLDPFMSVLEEWLGRGKVETLIKYKVIEAVPIAFMRGRTFRNSFIILDEAQNTSPVQMKLFLTRLGERSRMVVNGDPEQVDIRGTSGLMDAVERLHRLDSVGVIQFTKSDIVRHDLIQQILEAYIR